MSGTVYFKKKIKAKHGIDMFCLHFTFLNTGNSHHTRCITVINILPVARIIKAVLRTGNITNNC